MSPAAINAPEQAQSAMSHRMILPALDYLSLGKRARLHRLLYDHGARNGTLLLLPIDHGLEHGPRDFFSNPAAEDPDFECRLALQGDFSGIVFQIGNAEKYMSAYAGRVPLVVKINGKTSIPSDAHAFSPLTSSVEDAVRLGADAIGYTLYVGSPSQDRDIEQFNEVRREAECLGMPVIVWAYPRGEAIERKGGHDSLYAVEYAVRVACELGADVVKTKPPNLDNPHKADQPAPYNTLDISLPAAVERVIRAAGKTMVIFSGGSKVSDADLLDEARTLIQHGGTGLIYGRNLWQRPMDQALMLAGQLTQILRDAVTTS